MSYFDLPAIKLRQLLEQRDAEIHELRNRLASALFEIELAVLEPLSSKTATSGSPQD